jgi:hypothetical protein
MQVIWNRKPLKYVRYVKTYVARNKHHSRAADSFLPLKYFHLICTAQPGAFAGTSPFEVSVYVAWFRPKTGRYLYVSVTSLNIKLHTDPFRFIEVLHTYREGDLAKLITIWQEHLERMQKSRIRLFYRRERDVRKTKQGAVLGTTMIMR